MSTESSLLSALSQLNASQISALLRSANAKNRDIGELYTIYVHIIECRDLKPLRADGICDCVVSVNILSQTKSTVKIKRTFNPYFDQILVFKMNLNSEQLSSEKIEIFVFDTKHFIRNDAIGCFEFDLSFIHASKHREVYRQWTGLFDAQRINEGIRGYLLCSIAILGKNDEKKIHSADEEKKEKNVILPPFIEYKCEQLSVYIKSSEFLCDFMNGRMAKNYFFIFIHFGDIVLKSKQFEVECGCGSIDWNMNALLALRVPNFIKTVKISIFERIFGFKHKERMVATLDIDYTKTECLKWHNLYGAHFDETKYEKIKNENKNNQNAESCFRGNIAILCKVVKKCKNVQTKIEYDKIEKKTNKNLMICSQRKVKFFIFGGTNLSNASYAVLIQCGSQFWKTQIRQSQNENFYWNESGHFSLIHHQNYPLIFVYLLKHRSSKKFKSVPFAFYKVSLAQLMSTEWSSKPQWIRLTEDRCFDELKCGDPTPSLLISLCCDDDTLPDFTPFVAFKNEGSIDCVIRAKKHQKIDCIYLNDELIEEQTLKKEKIFIFDRLTICSNKNQKKTIKICDLLSEERESAIDANFDFFKVSGSFLRESALKKYKFFIGLYQARQLLAADETGLSDPYIVIHSFGSVFKSDIIKKRLNPVWNKGYFVDIALPIPIEYAPPILVQVWDYDAITKHDFMGFTFVETQSLMVEHFENASKPKWHSLHSQNGTKMQSEVLMDLQIINDDEKYHKFVVDLTPICHEVNVQIYVLGLRNIHSALSVIKPFASIHFPNGTNLATNASNIPSAKNPNFCQLFCAKMKLPKDAMFAPFIRVAVRDRFHHSIGRAVGWTFIELRNYCNDGWIHPNDFKKRHILKKNQQKILKKNNEKKEKKSENVYYDDSEDEDNANNFRTMLGFDDAVFSDDDDGNDSFGWSTDDAMSAMTTLNEEKKEKKQNEMSWNDLIGLNRIPELRERAIYHLPLEKELNFTPFIVEKVFCGRANNKKHIADLKCLIRVNAESENTKMNLSHLVSPSNLMCRLYILRGIDLIPMRTGRNAECNPYFVISLNNKSVINSRSKRRHNTCDPEWYQTCEIAVKVPGDCRLKIKIFDWNGDEFGFNDDVIGETVIDLEDRWFCSKWHCLSEKPIERRNLMHCSTQHRQV